MFKQYSKLRRLQIESLELRYAMDSSATGQGAVVPWFSPSSLTFSYAPDGTEIGESQSALFSTLDHSGQAAEWHTAIESAFDAWLSPLGSKVSEVPDSGVPFGSFGPTQGDDRFGDVRIGAAPLSSDILAEAIPHSMLVQGSWAGDILLNSNVRWESIQQVYAVALHEIGHVLGLGHSTSVDSAMYVGGIQKITGPSQEDIRQLKQFYTGLKISLDEEPSDSPDVESISEWRESPAFALDPATAIDLQPEKALDTRYSVSGELTSTNPMSLYRLLPLGEIDHAQFLNLIVSSKEQNGLIPSIEIYDESGDKVAWRVLHNSAGVLSIQAKDVEPNKSYFVLIKPAAAPESHQVGGFNFLAEYGASSLQATKVSGVTIGESEPIAVHSLEVHTTRLVHWMIHATSSSRSKATAAVWGTLIDEQGTILSQIALKPGDTRSAPLVLLKPGTYRVVLQTGTQNPLVTPMVSAELFIDEISIDVGAVVIDPTTQPMLGCDTPGNNPATCGGTPPIVINGPVFPTPPEIQVTVLPVPWVNPTWYYWPTIGSNFLRHNSMLTLDVSGDSIVSPIDALILVNLLNQGATSVSQTFADTNNDGNLSPLDLLLVINYLNSEKSNVGGEGESAFGTPPLNLEDEEIRLLPPGRSRKPR